MILTQNEKIYKSCYRLKNHGRDKGLHSFTENIGYNFAFTDLQAAIEGCTNEKTQQNY